MVRDIPKDGFKTDLFNGNDVIYFYLNGCGPCGHVFPIVEKLSEEYPGVNFYRALYDAENPEFKEFEAYYEVEGYPVIVMQKSGIIKVFLSGGNRTESEIRDMLDAVYKS